MNTRLRNLIILATMTVAILGGCSRENPVGPDYIAGPDVDTNHHDEFESPALNKSACSYTGKSHAVLKSGFRRIGLRVCRDHFALGSDAREALDAMISHINGYEGVSISLYVAGLADHRDYDDALEGDGVSRLDFVDASDCTASDCSFSGRTATYTDSSGDIDEFDIAFNEDTNWAFGGPTSWELSDGYSYFRTVLLHELCHGFGFPHVLDATPDVSIMGGKTGKWVGQKHTGLKAYDYGHLRHHYAEGGEPAPDLVLSNYTTEWDSDKSNWQCALTAGLSRQMIMGGRSLSVSFTQMNRGGTFSNGYSSKIYLSADEHVSASDIEVSSSTIVSTGHFDDYSTDLITRTISVPRETSPGLYHVLVKVDTGNTVAESNNSNNVLTIHEQLRVLRLREFRGVELPGIIK